MAPVRFEPAGGIFASNVTLTLSTSGDATVRFTMDGSEPNHQSPVYEKPLSITNNVMVRARAYSKTGSASAVTSEVFTLLDEELADFSSNLPLGVLNSFGSNILKEAKIIAGLQFVDGGTARTKLAGPASHSSLCSISMRGRASLRYPKNSFTVKTLDGAGDTMDAPLLGLPADNDWILYAPYPDKTLMRDVLAYEWHRQMGNWAPRTVFIELFVNRTGGKLTKRDYMGVYVLVERITRGKERVNIAKLRPEDNSEPRITGGYIFKKDHVDSGAGPMGGEGMVTVSTSTKAGYPTGPGGFPADPKGFQPPARTTSRSSSSSSSSRRTVVVITNHFGFPAHRPPPGAMRDPLSSRDVASSLKDEESFRTTQTNEFYFVEPEPDELTAVQKTWLKRHLNEVEAALYGPNFRDAQKGWRAYIDADSFIDYHLIVETTKNVDGFRFSVFYHKDRNGKIKADPIWDWNLSFGNANGKQGWIPEHWLWPQLDNREYTWYRRLFEDPEFAQRYVDRWSEFRRGFLATERALARIDELAARLAEAQKRNFEKWPILGRPINPNYFVGSTYEEEVEWMKKYIQTRLDWMEKQFLPVPKLAMNGTRGELSASAGRIYYTLDGSDPRAVGGEPSSAAKVYSAPVELPAGTTLFARVREDDRWSGPLQFKR